MKNPIIILEGQDRVGKSTLANQLANHFGPGTLKHHSSSPPKHIVYPYNKIWEDNNYFSLWKIFNEASETNAIVSDRFHLGMSVFGKRYRKYSQDLHVTELESLLMIKNNTFLFLLTDDPVALYNRDDGMSFEKSADDFAETATQFKTEFDLSIIPNKLHINITANGGFTNTFPTIIDFMKENGYANSNKY